jgi:hypothetical protein
MMREESPPPSPPSSNAVSEPILLYQLDARATETVLQGMRALQRNPALRRDCGNPAELYRIDTIAHACERALGIYWSWVEERERASQVSEAAAVLRRRESEARGRREAAGEGGE